MRKVLTTPHKPATSKKLKVFSFEELATVGADGNTLAFNLISRIGQDFDSFDILSLRNKNGWTNAHEQARHGYCFRSKQVLALRDDNGWTVAHEMARYGFVFKNPNINEMSDNFGVRVQDVVPKKSKTKKNQTK